MPHHIMPLVISALGGGHTDTHTYRHVNQSNFKKPGTYVWPKAPCAWFKNTHSIPVLWIVLVTEVWHKLIMSPNLLPSSVYINIKVYTNIHCVMVSHSVQCAGMWLTFSIVCLVNKSWIQVNTKSTQIMSDVQLLFYPLYNITCSINLLESFLCLLAPAGTVQTASSSGSCLIIEGGEFFPSVSSSSCSTSFCPWITAILNLSRSTYELALSREEQVHVVVCKLNYCYSVVQYYDITRKSCEQEYITKEHIAMHTN